MSEIPVHFRPRRLADWINPTGARKVHSLVDKVYQRKNLEMAWEKVKANRGSGGVDGQSLEAFAAQLDRQLDRLHDGGARKKGQKGAEVVPIPVLILSLLMEGLIRTDQSSQGRAVIGRGEANP
jgi:hypothetical protein